MPEMSAYEVCDKLVEAIESDKYDVIIINFANPDMVGHTGVEGAAIKAIEAVDECVGKTVEAIKKVDGQMFICADHGNAEQLSTMSQANHSLLIQQIRFHLFL